jgi:linoleoyl-CoA desaturase
MLGFHSVRPLSRRSQAGSVADGSISSRPDNPTTDNPTTDSPAVVAPNNLKFPGDSAFQKDLRRRIDAYFRDNGIEKTGNRAMHVKTAFWLGYTAVTFGIATLAPLPLLAAIPFFLLAGLGFAAIGFNIAHDAIHGSYSADKRVNNLLSWTFDTMGAASYTWVIAHNLLHHTYTNVPGTDTDIEPGPILRFQPHAKHYPWQRFQAVYAWFLYMFTSVTWVLQKDFAQAMQPHPRTGKKTPAAAWAKIVVGKVLHVLLFFVGPMVFGPHGVVGVVIGYFALHAVTGFTLAVVFQLAHVVEGVRYFQPDAEGKLPRGWMEHELLTTANFGETKLVTFICGGLDHQVEHHLFPNICHIHYPQLSPIVRQCAAEHGLPYLHSGTFFQAVKSHGRMLHALGNKRDVTAFEVTIPADATRAAAQVAAAA